MEEKDFLADVLKIFGGIEDNIFGALGGLGVIVAILYKIYHVLRSDQRGSNLSDDQESFRKMLIEQLIEQRNINTCLQREKQELSEKADININKLRAIRLNLEVFRKILTSSNPPGQDNPANNHILQLFNNILSDDLSSERNSQYLTGPSSRRTITRRHISARSQDNQS